MSRARVAIGPTVAHLARAVRGLHLLQAVFVAVAASCAVQTTAVLSGAAPFGLDGWTAGGLTALAAGATWWRAHPVTEARLARRIDRALGARGELETAWEAERRGGRLAPALTRRALADVEGRQLLRAAVPDSTLAVAAPILAATALALALEARAPRSGAPALAELAGTLASELGAAEQQGDPAGDSVDAGSLERRIARAAEEARDLADRSVRRPDLARELVEEAEPLFDELERLARETPGDADWRRALEAARNAAEALRDAVTEAGGPAGPDRRDDPSAGAGAEGAGAPRTGNAGERNTGDGSAEAWTAPPDAGPATAPEGAPAAAPSGPAPTVPPLELTPADAVLVDAWTRTVAANR